MKRNLFIIKSMRNAAVVFFLTPLMAWSCQTEIKMDSTGSSAVVGATGIVVVTITQTHEPCQLAIEKTEVKTTGCAIVGATPWKEIKPRVFIRKYKVKFEAAGEAVFEIKRTCPRNACLKEFLFKISN